MEAKDSNSSKFDKEIFSYVGKILTLKKYAYITLNAKKYVLKNVTFLRALPVFLVNYACQATRTN